MVQDTLQRPLGSATLPSPASTAQALKTGIRGWTFLALMHMACLGVFFVGFSWLALGVAVAFYLLRMFGITAGYHRYFSHRAYKTSRPVQFVLALLGCAAAQQGPLWWAAHHRHHHQYSDKAEDIHSPRQRGFWHAHIAWITEDKVTETPLAKIPDFARYPELRWLNQYHMLVPVALGALCYGLGALLNLWGFDTNGLQMLIWGFFISTVALYHGTFTINSLSHVFGSQRYTTGDDSRNNLWLALLTLGEGWHNNHHYYATSARQGFYWWEIDISYYMLWLLSKVGLVWELKQIPAHLKARHREI